MEVIRNCNYINRNTKMSTRHYRVDFSSFTYLEKKKFQKYWWIFSLFLLVSLYQPKLYFCFCHNLHYSEKHIRAYDLNANTGFFQNLWIFSSCFVIGSQLYTIYHREEAITFIFLGAEKFDKVDTWHTELW